MSSPERDQTTEPHAATRSAFGRLFRNPETGELAIVQLPNIPLWIFIVATAGRLLLRPHGAVATAVSIVSGIAIVWWSIDEILRGDSLFRRMLGGVVLAAIVAGLLMR